MAVTSSGLFYPTWRDILNQTQLAIDLSSDTDVYLALFKNTITPNFATDTAYGSTPYNSQEATGGAWSSGGMLLTGTTVTDGGTALLKWDASDISVGGTSVSNARCALLYYAPSGAKSAICLVDFTNDYSTVNGTFTVSWASGGILTIDLTP